MFRVYTTEETLHLDRDHGWFYGLVLHKNGRVYLAEIMPGVGWTKPFWRDIALKPWRLPRDLLRCHPEPVSWA